MFVRLELGLLALCRKMDRSRARVGASFLGELGLLVLCRKMDKSRARVSASF